METGLALGDPAVVREQLDWIDALRPVQRTPMFRAMRARFGALLDAREGTGDPAAAFVGAAAGYTECGRPFLAAVTQLEHAEWGAAVGRPEDAEELLARAGETFERLRAIPYLERVDSARALLSQRVAATT
jgi:hypothetical protein